MNDLQARKALLSNILERFRIYEEECNPSDEPMDIVDKFIRFHPKAECYRMFLYQEAKKID